MNEIMNGKWVMITTRLPVKDPPPFMSIFFAVPWPMDIPTSWQKIKQDKIEDVKKVLYTLYDYSKEDINLMSDDEIINLNKEHRIDHSLINGNYYNQFQFEVERRLNAMQIRYNGQQIRIFSNEYSDIKKENMALYAETFIFHEVLSDFSDLWEKPKDPDEKFIYEAALLDGCNNFQASNILNGKTAEEVDDFPVPNGWYEVPEIYRAFFDRIYA